MSAMKNEPETIIDFITGKKIPLIGAEENIQMVARILVNEKGYAKEDIQRKVPIELSVNDELYRSKLDLVVFLAGKNVLVIKCAAGSLGSREREALAAARLLGPRPIPLCMVSDGKAVVVLDTKTGSIVGKDWEAVPDKETALNELTTDELDELSADRRRKEILIFRSYDSMNVNIN